MKQNGHIQYELDVNLLRNTLPDGPGVYLFADSGGRVIYVGKAKSLRKRVLSYFRHNGELSAKTRRLMKMARGLDFILTSTEQEAFILERNLIKKYMPRYNIILRDDKQYPCFCLDIREPFPRLGIVRRIRKDGALYFGPFSSANSVRSTKKVIDRVFKLRKCKSKKLQKRIRPCLNFQMNHCLAPCTHEVPVREYREMTKQVRLFLEGHSRELIKRLKQDMGEASANLDFERAAEIRDQIRGIEKTVERQHVVSPRMEDQDVIGLAQKGEVYEVVVLFVRGGVLTGTRNFLIKDRGAPASEVMEAFLKQYYSREAFIPKKILISEVIEDLFPIMAWLSDLSGKKVVIHRPQRGDGRRLIRMAGANAEHLLVGYQEAQKEDLMVTAKSVLGLTKTPRVIEGLDISNFQGGMAVGTIVSFVQGQPHRAGYRNFRIKKEIGIDDYGMMAEIAERRIAKGGLPDLFLVDGGKGHLATVRRVLDREMRLQWEGARSPDLSRDSPVPEVISIAKPDENSLKHRDKIYLPNRKNPLILNADHPVLLLMIRIRDEAHRRAIRYHRRLREKNMTRSDLDDIPGIGKKRKMLLLSHFKDIGDISKATIEGLEQVQGITHAQVEAIFRHFSKVSKR
ncbi:MAG: excinuclease ABC subunit UvrC [Proteobacteria bacterium]|nr:excinuclease ABC subunit UvrC [Desulfobacteraceae bacterium]MBL7171660.1 excinuclease ABC subunit UvrC [Desulfobacteraceae bacterium]MBU0736148.1 excinuclease ABC subunit UvrC [Pseudomonadota bacterium]MBU1902145.1 excinuclease ABC subunit UvrC [Pseudomonadota bacterium]